MVIKRWRKTEGWFPKKKGDYNMSKTLNNNLNRLHTSKNDSWDILEIKEKINEIIDKLNEG